MKRILQTVRQTRNFFRACFFVALLTAGATHAFAQTVIDMNGTNASGAGYNYDSGVLTISVNGTYTISGSNGRIAVNENLNDVNITLDGVNLDVSGTNDACAFEIGNGSTVRLTLEGTNTLMSGNSRAGLQRLNGDGALEITAASTGSLTATGGGFAAGIGGSAAEGKRASSNITISGGTVTAIGGWRAAGIGGGLWGNATNITISGGTVKANGDDAAGIGGGNSSIATNITISGGTVTANGDTGIGGGSDKAGINITISGGTVTANGSNSAIGGGGNISASSMRIYGGSVKMNNHKVPQPYAEDGITPVFLNTLKINGLSDGTPVTKGVIGNTVCSETPSGGSYGIRDVKTATNGGVSEVYFYLPATSGAEKVMLGASTGYYSDSYTRAGNNDDNTATLTTESSALAFVLQGITQTPHDFGSLEYGYTSTDFPALSVTVRNTGNIATGALTLTGSHLTFLPASLSAISTGSTSPPFTVQPNTGLPAGTYTDTVKVTDASGVRALFTVRFTVTPKAITINGGTATAKDYDGITDAIVTALTFDGLQYGETLDLTTDYTFGVATYADANAGIGKTITATGVSLVSNPKTDNYILTAATGNLTGDINKRDIAVNGGTATARPYDSTTDATVTVLTFDDLQNNEVFDLTTDYIFSGATYASKDVGTGIAITATGVTLVSNPKTDNYNLTATTGALTGDINKRDITVNGGTATARPYDSTSDATVTALTFDGLQSGETFDLTTDYIFSGATYADANAGIGKTITATGVTLVANSKTDNYNLTASTGTLTGDIDKRDIAVNGGTATAKDYDGTPDATVTALTFSDLQNGETFDLTDDYTFSGATYASEDVGTGIAITASGVTLVSNSKTDNYNLTATTGALTGDINKRDITVNGGTATARPYDSTSDATVTTLTFDGLQNGETLDLTTDYTLVGATYADANAGTGKTITATGVALVSNPKTDNYNLTASTGTLTGDIDKRDIAVNGGTATAKDYDGTPDATVTALTFSDLQNGETFDLTDDYTFSGATYASKDVGTGIAITASGVTLVSNSKTDNYNLTATTGMLTGDINKRDITVNGGTATARPYDSTSDATVTTLTFDGLQNGETLDLTTDYTLVGATYADANAGIGKTITATGVALVVNSKTANYNLTASTGTLTGDIDKKDINITGGAATKIYDGTTVAAVSSLTFDFLPANSELFLGGDYTVTTATYADANVGTGITVTVDVTLESTLAADNYSLINGTGYGLTTGAITPATPTAAVLDFDLTSVIYDGSAHPLAVTAGTGIIGLGAITAVYYDGVPTLPVNVKTYTVTVDIDPGANYIAAAGLLLGSYTITDAAPPATAFDFTLGDLTYDGRPHPVPITVNPGIIGLGAITAVKYNGSTTPPTTAGTYTVTIDLAAGTNYAAIANLSLGSFTIAPATPTIAALAFTLSNVTYDDRPHPVTVTPATGIEGLGAITVRYNGSTAVPVYPGTYTVTIDIAAGVNYTAVTGLPAGTFAIYDPPTPVIRRRVTLLPTAGLTTDPPAGSYYINSGTNFTFTLTPDVSLPDGALPVVQTDRSNAPDGSTGIRVTPNADGSYTVVVLGIRQNIEITLSTATDNVPVGDGALTLGTAPGALVIANSRPEAATLRVYTPAGTLVRLTTVPPGTTRLAVPAGVYIVTDGGAFCRKTVVFR